MSCSLRHEQDCLNGPDCNPAFPRRPRPARHGGLCTPCYMAAAPEVRATADRLADALSPTLGAEVVQLRAMYDAPAYTGARRAA